MTGSRKWLAIGGIAAIAIVASLMSAFAGPPQAASAPAASQPAKETATQLANREATGKAPPGPWAYSGASGYTNYLGQGTGRSPVQPIAFPHPVHVNTLKMNCVFCHFAAGQSPDPGMPAVGTCMGCHQLVAVDRPEVKKLADYYNRKLPVPWVRVHKLPEYVRFPHMRHINAGVTCQSCHGQVNNMPQVFQYASLNMGWCVSCHVNGYSPAEGLRAAGYEPDSAALAAPRKKATYDCSHCHY
ncbi:MAG TPA: cytochrome c3 family protein [Gemmatimonadaceae bacterium]|nr:cytochrome c3 family protein [Gemmatimonadaceae bacterium]